MINKNIIFAEENIIAHGCNCQGKMGSGVAKAIRDRWPKAYYEYKELHKERRLYLGTAQLVNVGMGKYVANCMTQLYYGYDNTKTYASISAIEQALVQVCEFAKFNGNMSVALPPIGCGLGGLSWNDVGPVVEKIFNGRGVRFQVYDYRAENWRS